jgi:non-ribosomal peptide synthase protein (TIGR01720 family)
MDIREAHTSGTLLKSVQQQLSDVPHKGLNYGLLRYYQNDDPRQTQLAHQSTPAVSFNYLGRFDQTFDQETGWRLAQETNGQVADGAGSRVHLLDVAISAIDGCLQVQLAYSSQLHMQTTIERLTQNYLTTLSKLIKYCLDPEAQVSLTAGFPRAKLNQKQLNKFIAKMSKKGS